MERYVTAAKSINGLSETAARRLTQLRNAKNAGAEPAAPGSRLAIGKRDLATAEGAELLALCQTAADDGSLSEEEVAALRGWLDRNQGSTFPAQNFLNTTVERIVADGVVTDEERRELYRAVEAVLPPEIRKVAARRRLEVTYGTAEPVAPGPRPLASFDFMVAGVLHEGRVAIVEREASVGDAAFLVRDLERIATASAR